MLTAVRPRQFPNVSRLRGVRACIAQKKPYQVTIAVTRNLNAHGRQTMQVVRQALPTYRRMCVRVGRVDAYSHVAHLIVPPWNPLAPIMRTLLSLRANFGNHSGPTLTVSM